MIGKPSNFMNQTDIELNQCLFLEACEYCSNSLNNNK